MHYVGIDTAVRVPAAALVAAARSFVGVPFLHQGRTRQGIDCVGLVIASLMKVGVIFYEEPPIYPRLPNGDSLMNPLREYCTRTESCAPGVLLAIRFRRAVTHVALLADTTIVHAYEGAKKTVEHSYDKRWQTLTVARWHLPGVIYDEAAVHV